MKQRLILALGGGGARGFAHIGVLKALEEMGIRPTHISGTSMGAFVGGVYAKTGSAEKTEAAFRELFRWDGFRENAFIATFGKHDETIWANLKSAVKVLMMKGNFLTKPFYYDGKGFEELIRFFFPENSNFEDLRIPFAAMTTDLITGKSVAITSGKVVPAIVASASITGMMPPVLHKNYLLVDGEVTDLIPVRPFCHHGMNVIIGVDVSKVPAPLPKHPETGLEILIRKDDILQSNYRTVLLQDSDLVIRPAVQDVDWTDYTEFDNLIRVGYKETMHQKEAILSAIRKKRSFINHLKSYWKPETHSWIHEDETEILRWE